MKNIFKKPMTATGKLVVSLLTVILTLFILVEILLFGAIAWLQTGPGQNWLRGQITTALADSPYQVDFTRLSYHFPQGLTVRDLEIADAQGPFLTASHLTVRTDILALPARHLDLHLRGGHISLTRLPQGPATGDDEPDTNAITAPAIFFTTLTGSFTADRLTIAENIAGREVTLTPVLDANIQLGASPALNLALALSQPEINNAIVGLPETLAFSAALNPRENRLTIRPSTIKASLYELETSGTVALAAGTLDLSFDGTLQNLTQFNEQLAGTIPLTAALTGTLDDPVLTLRANPALTVLHDAGLRDMEIETSLHPLSDMIEAPVTVRLRYRDQPATINTTLSWAAPDLAFNTLVITAPELAAHGDIAVNTDTGLLGGTITAESQDWAHYTALFDIDAGAAGAITTNFSATEDSQQHIALAAALENIRYDSVTIGALDTEAKLTGFDSPWPHEGTITAKNLRITDDLRFESLHAAVTWADNGYRVTIDGRGRAANDFILSGQARATNLAEPLPTLSGIDLQMRAGGSGLNLTGSIDPQNIDLALRADQFAMTLLPFALPDMLRPLTLSGTAGMTGTPAQPALSYDFAFSPLAITNMNVTVAADGAYTDGQLRTNLSGRGTGIRTLTGTIIVPFTFTLQPFAAQIPSDQNLDGTVTLDADAAALSALFLPPGHLLTGTVTARAALGGAADNPDISGDFNLRDGSYSYNYYGLHLRDLQVDGALTRDSLQIRSLSAHDGAGGTLTGDGHYSWQDQADTAIELHMDDFHLLRSDRANGYVTTDLTLDGQPDDFLLRGTTLVGPLDIVIPEQFQRDIPSLNIVRTVDNADGSPSLMQQIRLDIAVRADDRVFVRGWGLDAEFGGALDITGTLPEPLLNGTLQSVRGRYEELGRRFDLAQAILRFQGTVPPSPYLDIRAVTDLENISAAILLSGPITAPELGFDSVPSLPDDEILARILFGRDMRRLTPFQALQLKQTMDRFAGRGGGPDPLAELRALVGVDDIRIETGAEGGASVGVGKYLTDDVYLELEKGAMDNSGGASMEIELTPNIKLDSKIGADAQTGAGIQWKWDY